MIKILFTYRIPEEGLLALGKDYAIDCPLHFYTKDEIIAKIADYDVLFSAFSTPVDKEIIEAGKKLKLISNYGVGYNHIDIKAASDNNIMVCNTPQSVCIPTAELCLGLILSLSRKISEHNHRLRVEDNFKWGSMNNLGTGLYGKTLGIIGMGRIGIQVSKFAHVFGMNIVYHNRTKLSQEIENDLNISYLSLSDLLSSSDVISLHTPLNDDTHHLINAKELNLMKKTSFLINTSRGPIINENDLVYALEKKTIGGAALDVFENEPNIHPSLLCLNNVVIVPHIGTASIDSMIAMGKEAGENIINFFNESPTNIVN
ncbi:MAG: NAD(P)-dependent oxidoreductase [Marinifilaceae bacterium]